MFMYFDSQDPKVSSCIQSDFAIRVTTLLKRRSHSPNPPFGSHASYHIALKHHGEEAVDGDVDMEDPCYPCNAYVALECW